jgi:putative flippase GtrA
VSLAGNTLLVPALVKGVWMATPVAALVAIGVCGVGNFLLADRLVFAGRSRGANASTRLMTR